MEILTGLAHHGLKEPEQGDHGMRGLPVHFLILIQVEELHVCPGSDPLRRVPGDDPKAAWALARLASMVSHRWKRLFSENRRIISSYTVSIQTPVCIIRGKTAEDVFCAFRK